jgi:hypothetical protein
VAPWQRRLLGALVLLGLLVSLGFGFGQGWGLTTLLLFLALLGCSAVAMLGLLGSATGQLRWDGEQWHWSGQYDAAVTDIRCILDLQRVLLLHIRCEQGARHWLWLESGAMDAGWLAVRRAVVAAQAAQQSAKFNSLR